MLPSTRISRLDQEIHMRLRSRALCSALLVLAVPAVSLGAVSAAAARSTVNTAAFINWSSYLFNTSHTSSNAAATAITTANAATLKQAWKWVPAAPTNPGQPAGLLASPTVVNGTVYIGANTGIFYALNEATGAVLWHRSLGYVTTTTCGALGIVSTATVAPAPGSGTLTVYVAGGNGYLYALNAATGAVVWRSVIAIPSTTINDYYDWSSPTVLNGRIYVGVSSNCDNPLVKGGLKEYDQATGAQLAHYLTYPGHTVGASIWSSAAADPAGKSVFVTTGNGPGGDAVSVVRLDALTLAKQDAWQIPSTQHGSDSDFGGSPTLFTATVAGVPTPMVGACNKNGVYYAFRRNDLHAGPVWHLKVGTAYGFNGVHTQCDAAAVWDGTHLFIAANQTAIKGVTYAGSVREVDPATGALSWQRGLTGAPIGSPTLNGSGALAVTEYSTGAVLDLINAKNGTVLRTFKTGRDFGQPVFADNLVLMPTQNYGLWAYKP
jgi:polyvinyl alcohol dehydrogenase (cytochrome)